MGWGYYGNQEPRGLGFTAMERTSLVPLLSHAEYVQARESYWLFSGDIHARVSRGCGTVISTA